MEIEGTIAKIHILCLISSFFLNETNHTPQNQHQTDTIVVYSTYIEPSVVFPADVRYNGIAHSENSTPLPPSSPIFHGEYDKDRQLHIPPRTAVTLPVSIIPHWRKPPDLEFDRHHGNRHYRKLDMKEGGKENEGSGSTESKSSRNDDVGQDENDSESFPSASDSFGKTNNNNSTIHTVVQADLLDMILTDPIGVPRESRAQLLDSATIHETLIANTSYGIVQMKVPSVCSPDTKEYEFGLPNNLMFIDSNGGWYSRRNTTPTVELAYMFGTLEYNPTRNIQDPFMYNLYMNNPTNKELRIWEVYTTKPHLVGVYTQKRHGMSGSTPYPPPSTKMSADQLFQSTMVHRPKQNNIYVKTLRLYPNSFSREMTLSIQDLGFVIIKTNLGSFSIALDYIPDTRRGWEVFARYERNKHNSTFIHWAGANQTSLGDGGYLVQDAVMDSFVSSLKQDIKQLSYLEKMTITKSYVQDLPTKGEGWKGKKYLESEHQIADDDAQELNSTLSLIKANPATINFGSITTGSRTIRIPIQLKNYHSKPLRIMRISIAMSLVSDNGDGNVTDISNESSGMEIGVEFFDGVHPTPLTNNGSSSLSFFNTSQTFLFSQEIVLPPMNPNKFDFLYPLHVWCRFNADSTLADDIEARFYSGSILIHATESGRDVPYRVWEQQLLLDHSTSSSSTEISNQYLLQIPFTGSVLPGNLGCPTESLLFPAYFSVLPPEERIKIMKDQPTAVGNEVPRYYDRTLDITNNFDVPITIIGMKIVDSTGAANVVNSEDQNFCSSRFTFDSMSGGGQDPLTAQSGKKWKGLSIRYHFFNDNEQYFLHANTIVKKCVLSLETNRAGKQSLPLVIYNGEVIVEIERPSDLSGNDGQPPEFTVSAMGCLVTKPDGQKSLSRSGMPCMKDWLKTTKEGVVLNKALADWHASLSSNERQHSGLRKSSSFKKCANAVLSGYSDANDPVNSYFRSLLSNPTAANDNVLNPIVLPFGAVHAGDTMSRSILLTNLNHAPVEVMATSAALGNMNVTVAIVPDQNIIVDYWKQTDEPEELEYTLKNSPVAMKFLSKFHHTFDIVRSPRIPLESELTTLFYRHYTIELFDNATDYIQTNYIGKEKKGMECTHGLMLSADGNLTSRIYKRRVHSNGKGKKKWTIPPGGVGRFEVSIRVPPRSKLKTDITPFVGTGLVLETNFGQALPIIVTYSAIAGKLELKPFGYNITDVAKAQEEERMVWHRQQRTDTSEERRETEVTTVVQVPLTFKDPKLTSSIDNFAQNRGVALSIQSTFAQDIYLSELRSCNKWFNVFLPANNPDARDFFHKQGGGGPGREGNWSQQSVNYLRINGIGEHFQTDLNCNHDGTEESYAYMVPLGKVLSALSCSHPSGDTSFYACALAWLENRNTIQPPGCGLDEHEGETHMKTAIQKARTDAIGALRDVVAWLSVRYKEADESKGKGESTTEGYVHFSRSHMFAHARDMWNAVASLGLNTITGHIRARTLYDQNDAFNSIASGQSSDSSSANSTGPVLPPLSIPVSSVLLESKLNIPKIFWDNKTGDKDPTHVGVVNFGTVHVADTATRYVKVVNPTAMTIRVRLTATDSINGNPIHDNKDVYVQSSPMDHHSWWTGTSYWMADDTGHLISASHNVTIKSGAGAFVSLLNPALHSMSAFLLGCGKRCGLRNEQDTNSVGDEKNYSPIGAASGDGSSLIGRPHSKEATSNDKKSSPQTSLGIADPPSFSLGRASNEIVLKPYSFAELGPVYFRPPGRGDFEGTILIENSLTGFEEVTVRGRGGWEQLVFLEGPSSDQHASDIEFRFGKSAMVFSGSHVPISERGNGPIVKSVRLANKGDIPVEVSKVYMASSEVMHFTHKRRHPSQSMGNSHHDDSKCSERGFVLPGCVESSNFWIIDTLFTWCKSIFDFLIEKLALSRSEKTEDETTEESDSFYKDGFTLRPNQTITMFVLHYPDCTFQTSYASIIFEIGDRSQQGVAPTSRNRMGSWQQTFRKRKVELLVGYDMSASEFRQCVPYTPPESSLSIWERKIEFQISPLLQDVLSFGLTRLKDRDGNSFMPRRPIEITLVAASFILLLFALSLDLLFTVEISATRKSCPSWKPTCRCLARADPTSSDLVSIGKEQTKHVLLSRFKKEGVLPSQMLQSDGSFNRGLTGSKGSGTHSEAIFDRLNLINESKMNKVEGTGLLPCGLGWRTAMRRGVGLASSAQNESPELQYLTRTRDRYVKKQKQIAAAKKVVHFAPASPATPATPKDRDTTINNGHSTFAQAQVGMRAVPAPAPQAQYRKVEPQVKKNGKSAVAITKPAPQSKPPTATRNVSDTSSKGSNNSSGKSSSVDKVKTTEPEKQSKNQQNVQTGRVSSSQTDQTIKVVDTKGKQKQRNETAVKNVAKKDDRINKSETKKATQQEEPSSSKTAKTIAGSQKTRAIKLDVISAGSNSKTIMQDEKKELGSPSRKETKQTRQAKKTTNGTTKSVEQPKGKQGKQKVASKKAIAKDAPKSPLSTKKSTAKHHPHSPSAAISPTQSMSKSNVRPPPGLLAPPGFIDQPDLEGVSTPSSPSASPQRVSSTLSSPLVQPKPNNISGMEIQSPPLNNDLISIIGSGDNKTHEISSLFQLPSEEHSPRSGSESGLSVSVPEFRPQFFTPPTLEPSITAESNSSEQQQTPDVQALLGGGSNFNVSNFLDGILSDPPPSAHATAVPVKLAEVTSSESSNNPFLSVSLDPWNTSSDNKSKSTKMNNPLAALRGVGSNAEQQSPIIAGIPFNSNAPSLLSATSTLQQNNNSNAGEFAIASVVSDDNGDNNSTDFLEPDSFYSNLLGE